MVDIAIEVCYGTRFQLPIHIVKAMHAELKRKCPLWTATRSYRITARDFASGGLTSSISGILVILPLSSSDVSLSSIEVQTILGCRVLFATIAHPISPIRRGIKTAAGDSTLFPSIGTVPGRARRSSVMVVRVEANVARSSQTRTSRHVC